jgi:hypothetical protein
MMWSVALWCCSQQRDEGGGSREMFERRILRGLMLAMALALIVALLPTLALAERHSAQRGPGLQAVGHVTISGDPLTITWQWTPASRYYTPGSPAAKSDHPVTTRQIAAPSCGGDRRL